jgi:hypothetical protein
MILRYHKGETNRCPNCGRTHWLIGRSTAECAFCTMALPLADSRGRTPRVVGWGNGGGKVSRELAAA